MLSLSCNYVNLQVLGCLGFLLPCKKVVIYEEGQTSQTPRYVLCHVSPSMLCRALLVRKYYFLHHLILLDRLEGFTNSRIVWVPGVARHHIVIIRHAVISMLHLASLMRQNTAKSLIRTGLRP